MIRARYAFAATLVASLAAGTALAQTPAPKFEPILAGKDFKAPLRGAADVEFARPPVKREKDMVIDEFTVKNISTAPIARLTIESIYYDKGGAVIAGGKSFVNGLLKPGEVQTVKVETPYNARMNASNYKFTHANGAVTPKRVDKIVDPAQQRRPPRRRPAAAKAAATRRPPRKEVDATSRPFETGPRRRASGWRRGDTARSASAP